MNLPVYAFIKNNKVQLLKDIYNLIYIIDTCIHMFVHKYVIYQEKEQFIAFCASDIEAWETKQSKSFPKKTPCSVNNQLFATIVEITHHSSILKSIEKMNQKEQVQESNEALNLSECTSNEEPFSSARAT